MTHGNSLGMHARFRDYRWIHGKPKGISPDSKGPYRIVMDPYQKWVTIEKYRGVHLEEVVYDSHLLDFRTLKPFDQQGWRREEMLNTPNLTKAWVFNADDRAIFQEESFYEKGRCRQTRVLYPCGRLLCIHHLYYTQFKDPFDGVMLADAHEHPVMIRKYKASQSGEWEAILDESWEPDLSLNLGRV